MKTLAQIKTLTARVARRGLLAALVSLAFTGGAATLHAAKDGAPAYYAAYEIPAPAEYSGSQDRAVVVTMNDQGYAIVVNGFSSGGSILVYVKDHYLQLSTAGLNLSSPTSINASHLSNVAADGSFNVTGEADFADGFHRVVFWHVNADGTNAPQMMKNRVLPENSQQPGEQHSASSVAVSSGGVIAGNVQSYLAGLGAFWYPPETTPNSPFEGYQGPTDLDEAGNFSGQRSEGAGGAAQYNNGDLVLPTNVDSRTYRLKNGRIAGEYVLPDYTDHTFVSDVVAHTFAELPVYDPTSSKSENQQVKLLDDAGDAIGESYSPNINGYVSDYTFWKKDPNTGDYTAYNIQKDLVGPVYTDTYLSLVRNGSNVGAFLADGTFVVNGVQDLYHNNPNAIVVFKPGADPRPVINLPVGSTSYISLHTEPGQPFSYQLTATNNPTAFTLAPDSAGNIPSLPAGLTLDPATGLLSGTTTEIAAYSFSVQATNGQGVGALTRFVFLTSGEAPVITSAAAARGVVGQAFSFQVTATNSPTSFYFRDLPAGLTYNSATGLITGTPTTAGTFAVGEQVDNAISGGFSAYPSATGTLTITITDAPVVTGGSITSATTASGTVNKIFAYQITADFTPTAYDAVGLPDGLSVNQSTGLISGVPTRFADGAHTVEIYASDDSGHDASLTLTITIAAAPVNAGTADLTLTVVDSPDPVVVGGTVRYTFTLVNHGPDAATGLQGTFVKDSKMTLVSSASTPGVLVNGNALTFPLPNLASGLSETFVLAFTADAAGVYTVGAAVQADQTDPHTSDDSLLATTEAKAGSTATHAPVITAAPGGQILAGDAFTYQITTDGTVPVDAFTATGLPPGLSVNGVTGLISGTVAVGTAPGDFTVTLRAANGAGASTATRTFTVVAPPSKGPDLLSMFGGDAKVKSTANGKVKLKGTYTLANLGKKAAKNVTVALYLSNTPAFSFPVGSDPAGAGYQPLPVMLATTDASGNPTLPSIKVIPATGGEAGVIALPVPLAKAGKEGSTFVVPLNLKVASAALKGSNGQSYRYLLVVADPQGVVNETSKSNNVAVLDLAGVE